LFFIAVIEYNPVKHCNYRYLQLFVQFMKQDNIITPCGWDTCSEPIRKKVTDIFTFLQKTLGDGLVGFYLHGSLATGCFNLNTSDIDLLAVVKKKLTVQQKKDIITYLQGVDQGPGKAPPEISIITTESLEKLVYPSPFELHYSNNAKDVYTSGKVSWEEQRFDTDLSAHYMAVRERGICIYGKPIKEAFPEIPPEIFMASLVQDLGWIRQQIKTLPFTYIVLNPCRAMAYASEGKYMSKKEGGEWALQQLPVKYTTLIGSALAAYCGAEKIETPEQDALSDFIDYAIKEFIYLASKTDAENLFFKESY
jgi:predicted nucleotidyltransferase